MFRARGESTIDRGVLGNFQIGHEKTAQRLRVFQDEADDEVLVDIVGECIFLEFLSVLLKHREMDKRIAILVQYGHEAGEVHLTGHLEVEEVAGDIDAALHEVVVEDGGIEIIHDIAASAITIDGVVKVKLTLHVIDVETFQVGNDVRADFRN